MSPGFTESIIEQAAMAWLERMRYMILSRPEIDHA